MIDLINIIEFPDFLIPIDGKYLVRTQSITNKLGNRTSYQHIEARVKLMEDVKGKKYNSVDVSNQIVTHISKYPLTVTHKYPVDTKTPICNIPPQGRFGAQRTHDIHTGLDFYCKPGTAVFPVEEGIVVNVFQFTGTDVHSPWWNDTMGITVKGKSGVILYGEIETTLKIGDKVSRSDEIGKVLTVLKEDKGLPMTMLHLELYDYNYTSEGEIWKTTKPEALRNVEQLF